MRRVYAYLMKQRYIGRDNITSFARAGTLSEDHESAEGLLDAADQILALGQDLPGVFRRHAAVFVERALVLLPVEQRDLPN